MQPNGLFYQEIYPVGSLQSTAPAVAPAKFSAAGQVSQSASGNVTGEAPAVGLIILVALALILVHTSDM